MADLSIKAVIEILLRGKGAEEAAKLLREIEEEAKRASKDLGDTGKSFDASLKAIQQSLGQAAAEQAQVTESAKETARQLNTALGAEKVRSDAADVEAALGSAGLAMHRLGTDADEALPILRQIVASIEAQGGAVQTETIPAFERFLGITEDWRQATAAVQVSSEVSRKGLVSYGQAVDGVAALMEGKVPQAASALGISLNRADGAIKSETDLLGELQGKYGDIVGATQQAGAAVELLARQHAETGQQQQAAGQQAEELTESTKTAETSQRSLGDALRAVGQDTAENVASVERFAQALEDAGGPVREQTIPAIAEFLAVTRDVPAALSAAQLAADLAAKGNVSYEQSAKAVSAVLRGDVVTAAEALGVAVRTSTGELREQEEILREVEGKYGDFVQRAREARAAVDGYTDSANKAEKATGLFSGALGKLGQFVVGLFGIYQLFNFLKSSIQTFAEIQRGLNATGFAMQRFGIDADTELPKVAAHLREIQRAGGPLLTETIPIFQGLIGVTKDVNAALALTKLAADISEAGFISAGAAADALVQILQGKAVGAASTLRIELRKQNGEMKTGRELLDELRTTYFGLGDQLNDTKSLTDRAAGAFNSLKESTGRLLGSLGTSILEVTATRLDNIAKNVDTLSPLVEKLTGKFRNLWEMLAKPIDPDEQERQVTRAGATFDRFFTRIKAGFAEAFDPKFDSEAYLKGVEEAKAKTSAALMPDTDKSPWFDTGKKNAEDLLAGFETAGEIADRKRIELAVKAARETEIATLQTRLSLAQDGSADQLRIQQRILDLQHLQALADATETGEDKASIDARFNAEEIATATLHARKLKEIRQAAQERVLQAVVEAEPEGTEARLNAELALLDHQHAVEREKVKGQTEALAGIEATYNQERANKQAAFVEQRAAFELDSERELLRQRIELAAEGSDERLALEREALESVRRDAVTRAQKRGASVAAINETFRLADERLVREHSRTKAGIEREEQEATLDAQRQAAEAVVAYELELGKHSISELAQLRQQAIDDRLAAELEGLRLKEEQEKASKEQTEAELKDIEDRYRLLRTAAEKNAARERAQAASNEAQQKIAAAQNYAGAAFAIAGALFENNKAIGMAEIVVRTAMGVMSALAQYPPNIPLAAFIAATGAAQLAVASKAKGGSSSGTSAGSGKDKDKGKLTFADGGHVKTATASQGDSGLLKGPGTPTSDSIATFTKDGRPVELSTDEYIVKGRAVRAFGVGNLDLINDERLPRPDSPAAVNPWLAALAKSTGMRGQPLRLAQGGSVRAGAYREVIPPNYFHPTPQPPTVSLQNEAQPTEPARVRLEKPAEKQRGKTQEGQSRGIVAPATAVRGTRPILRAEGGQIREGAQPPPRSIAARLMALLRRGPDKDQQPTSPAGAAQRPMPHPLTRAQGGPLAERTVFRRDSGGKLRRATPLERARVLAATRAEVVRGSQPVRRATGGLVDERQRRSLAARTVAFLQRITGRPTARRGDNEQQRRTELARDTPRGDSPAARSAIRGPGASVQQVSATGRREPAIPEPLRGSDAVRGNDRAGDSPGARAGSRLDEPRAVANVGQPRDRAGTEGVAASRPVPFALSIPIVELARRLQQQIGGASATAAAGEPGRRGQAGQDGAATPAPSVVQHYDQREEVHITVNGLYGGRAGLNHLERELKQAAVRNRSKLIR